MAFAASHVLKILVPELVRGGRGLRQDESEVGALGVNELDLRPSGHIQAERLLDRGIRVGHESLRKLGSDAALL